MTPAKAVAAAVATLAYVALGIAIDNGASPYVWWAQGFVACALFAIGWTMGPLLADGGDE